MNVRFFFLAGEKKGLNAMVGGKNGKAWPGLFLVIFLAEPTGLSPHNFTEPDSKTASPAKKQCWMEGYLNCVLPGRGSDEICYKTFGQEQ